MAHHSATLKSIRQTKKRTTINRNRLNRARTFIKHVEKAINAGDKDKAQSALRVAQKELLRAVNKKIVKANTAARKISRLNAKVKDLVSGTKKSQSSEAKKTGSKKKKSA